MPFGRSPIKVSPGDTITRTVRHARDPYTGLDQFDRIADNRWYSTATSVDLDRIQHGYDRASNRLYRKNTVAEAAGVYLDELYRYDGINRLAELQRGQLNAANNGIVAGALNFGQAWGLDTSGNWAQFWQNDTGAFWDLQQSRTASEANEITGIIGGGWAQPIYDAAGNMVQIPQPSSPATPNAATFDAWNRMMSVSGGGSSLQRNAYDGEHRRVTKLVAGAARHNYFSTDWQSLEERLGPSTSPDRQFVWGQRSIDDLVLRDQGPDRLYALQDANWNSTGVCDQSGKVQERYSYASYGQPWFYSGGFVLVGGSSYAWETLFGGHEWDSESGYYWARNRVFVASVGRWLTRDPRCRGLADRSTRTCSNLYLLLGDNPPTFTDSSGLIETVLPFKNRPKNAGEAAVTCKKAAYQAIAKAIGEVCNMVNGDKGKGCIGKNLRKCLRTICANKEFVVKCYSELGPFGCTGEICAAATLVEWSDTRRELYPEKPANHLSDNCTPAPLPNADWRYGMIICWPNFNTGNPCGGSRHSLVLHELVHLCGTTHDYRKKGSIAPIGYGEPEACERSCYADELPEKLEPRLQIRDSCRCECGLGRPGPADPFGPSIPPRIIE